MARKTKVVNLYITPGTLSFLFRKTGDYDFSELSQLRQILSNERAKLINTIKTKNPESMYHLSKIAKRDFKSVQKDLEILQKFGIIEFKKESVGKRKKLKPVLAIDKLQINFEFT
jgi:predicted transcriptional regulator